MKIKQILKKKEVQTIGISLLINIGLLYLLLKSFDLLSSILYITLGLGITYFYTKKKTLKPTQYFVMGAVISATYNGIGMVLQLFPIAISLVIIAALQQGLVTFFVAKIRGKK